MDRLFSADYTSSAQLFDADYQDKWLDYVNGNFGRVDGARDEASRRVDEEIRARIADERTHQALEKEYLAGNSNLVWNPNTKSWARKGSNRVEYQEGQYLNQVQQMHQDYDNIRDNYGLTRDEVDLGTALYDTEDQIRQGKLKATPELAAQMQSLRDRLGERETAFRDWRMAQQPDTERGFIGNLASWARGQGWNQEDRTLKAWERWEQALNPKFDLEKVDEVEMARGRMGISDTLADMADNPAAYVPFIQYMDIRGTHIQDAALRQQSGREMYLAAARGDKLKAQKMWDNDRALLEKYKNDRMRETFQGTSLRKEVSDTLAKMIPYAAEMYITGGMARSFVPGVRRMAVMTDRAMGRSLMGEAGKMVAGGASRVPTMILPMASQLVNQKLTEEAIQQDEQGNWHYDDSNIDQGTLWANSVIQASAEVGSEFSGGVLGKLVPGKIKGLPGKLKKAKWVQKYAPDGKILKKFYDTAKKAHWDGTLEEMGEEYLNNFLVYATGAESAGAKNPEDFLDRMQAMVEQSVDQTPSMAISFAMLPGAAMVADMAATSASRKKQYRKIENMIQNIGEQVKQQRQQTNPAAPTPAMETVQPEQQTQTAPQPGDRPLVDGREPVSMDEIENVPETASVPTVQTPDEFAELNRKLALAYVDGKAPQLKPVKKLSRGQRAVQQIMQDLFGKEVVYYDASGAKAPDGISHAGDGKIYLHTKCSKSLLFAAFHEFYHELRGTEEGKAIAEVMRKAVKPEVYEAWKAKYNQANQNLGINQQNEDELFEEFCSDSLGTFSGRESFWKELASEQPGIVQKFLEWLAELKNMVVSRYAEEEAKSVIADLDRAEKQVATILKKETARHQKTRAVDGSMHVQRVKTGEIAADPARFQFKGDVDAEGVAQDKALGGQWDDKSAGVLYLWEDNNGRKFVVNGHHRLALANRLNVPEVNAIIDREADGVTAEQARRNGALQNIRQGQGTVLDYANFIRQEGMSEEEAGKEGLLSREEGRTGYLIGHYASDNLMDFFRNGDITAAKAAAIASVAHGDANLERVGLHLQKGMSAEALMQTLKLAQNELKNNAVQADDLFGDSGDAALREWEELGKRAQKKQDEIARDIKAIQNAVRNPETAKKGGVDVREKAKKNLERLKREQQRWKNWHTDAELIATIAGSAGNGKYEIGNMKYEMGAEPGSETAVNGQETQKAKPMKEKPAEPAAEVKAEPEAKVAEKAEMPKVEESATAKTPEIVKINTVAEITDEDFQKPYRSLELPSLPERTLKAMGKEAKPVLLKQNILVKNRNHHPELSEKDSRETLQKALYENDLVGQSQPSKRPNYWVAVQLSSGKNAVAVLDITETKTHHEIVGWRIINDKSLQALKNQAVREGGQILTSQDDSLRVSSDHTEPGNLSNTVTPETEKSSEAAGKVEEKAEAKNGQPKVEEQKPEEKPEAQPQKEENKVQVDRKFGKIWEKDGKKRLYLNEEDLERLGIDGKLEKFSPYVDLKEGTFVAKNRSRFTVEEVDRIRESARQRMKLEEEGIQADELKDIHSIQDLIDNGEGFPVELESGKTGTGEFGKVWEKDGQKHVYVYVRENGSSVRKQGRTKVSFSEDGKYSADPSGSHADVVKKGLDRILNAEEPVQEKEQPAVEKPENDATVKEPEQPKEKNDFIGEHVFGIPADAVRGKLGGTETKPEQGEETHGNGEVEEGGHRERQVRDGASAISGGVSEGNTVGSDQGGPAAERSAKGSDAGLGNTEGPGDKSVSGSGRSGRTGDGSGDVERGTAKRAGRVDEGGTEAGPQLVEENVSGRRESAVLKEEKASPKANDPDAVNHRIGKDDELIAGGDVSKIKANLDALRLLKKLEAENRNATADEKKVLAKYVGWGGLPQVFERGHRNYDELRELLTKEEWDSARGSTLNAHYTERGVIEQMWRLAEKLGFKGGKAGEFGAGIGHFLGLVPDSLAAKTKFRAVELDSVTGRMLQKLYPQADVTVAGLEDTRIANNSLSLVIGNFPFAKLGPNDKRYPKFSLHNYFFARAIDAVKPGGLVIALTSNSTLDNAISLGARKWLSERADLVGAIRLPNNAFKKNAGTEVVTDIIVLRKKDGTRFQGEQFELSAETTCSDGSGTARINEYYVKHPEMVLGQNSMTGGMYKENSYTVRPNASADLHKELGNRVDELGKRGEVLGTKQEAVSLENTPDTGDRKFGEYFIRDGKVLVQGKESAEEVQGLKAKDKERIESFITLKNRLNEVLKGNLDGVPDADLKKLQQKLKSAYDAFVKKFGNIADTRKQILLREDPNYMRAAGLEVVRRETVLGIEKKSYTPADIFTKRVIQKFKEPSKASSLEEAAQISLNLKNRIDPEYVVKLAGMQTENARQFLLDSGKFFEDPESGELESSGKYLSGNIADKLKAAEEAALTDGSFRANVEALKNAMPEAKKIDAIGFELGTTWLPEKVVEKWAEQDLGVRYPRIRYSEAGDFWTVEGNFYSVAGYNQDGKSAKDFLEAALNLKRIVINEKNIFGKSVPNKPATLAANELKKQMSERFVNYVKSHPELAEAVEKVYNEKINVVVSRDYQAGADGIYPGAADTVNGKPVRMREHQRALIARAIEGNTLIAHCVGAGKTYEMITTAMELKRLGLASKNLIVVQNSTVEQFGESAQALYPTANILCVSKNDFEKKNRKRFLMKVANNNWDIIVMPQSQFNMIRDRPEVEIRYMESKVAELEEALEGLDKYKNRLTVKELARQIKSMQAKADTLIKNLRERAEDVVYFDELGIDSLFIDEAHLYKKNFFVSKLPQMKGLDRSSSQRSLSLTLKIRQVMEKTGGRNIYLATGTPVTNTLAEVWNMVRYLYPEGKMPFGCNTFDCFASMFTETKSDVEQTAAGTYKSVERFVKFKNLGDLHKFFTSVADVVLPEDLKGVKRPPLKTGEAQRVIIPRSKEITKFMEYLNDLYSWFEGLSGEEKRENSALALQIYSMARKASIDMRLVDASLKDDPNSKLSACARKVAEKYKEYDSVKGTQAVFFDLYKNTDKATDKVLFNAYDELVRKLAALGIPENEIAHMGNDMTDKAKADLFDAVNAGRVRVIIGGTQTLGTGVNIQERLACVHHVDVPQLPADMEQRDGRILRQGNTIPEVEIFQYAVDKTLDSASYQMLARKKAFINDVMKGRMDGESEEQSGDSVSYAEFSAQISGNKDAIRMVKVKADVERLRAMAGAHAQQVRGNRSKLSEEQRAMNTMTAVKGALSENMKTFEAFDPKKITLPNGDVVERKDLIAWLDQYLEKHKGAFKFDFSISGIPVQLERYWSELEDTVKLAYTITIPGLKSGYAKYGGEFKNGTGFMQSFASNIGAKAEEAERLDRRMENQRELLKNLEESINAPFAEAKQLEALEAEYTELAGRLTSNESEKHFDERPDLHDYLDANVNMSAEVEFSEDEEDGEQGDAGKVKMSKPWTGEKEEYPAEWGKCFSQYRGKKYLAVQHLLHRKEGFVPAAFHREDIGDIDIVYGETGEGVKDKRGYGLAHIRKRHPGMNWKLFSQVIQTGELKEINDRRVNIVDGKAKVIIELEWKGQERKWVVSAMGGDLTSTADSLLASNPQEAAKQGIAPKGIITIGDLWEKSSQKSGDFQENDGGTIKFSIRREEPPKKTRTGYKVFAMFKSHPGELFPPMVANPGGASTPVGVWLNADAAPRAEDSKTGRPRVQSGGKGTNAGKATLAYRPGWHLGPLPEASQFLVKNPETGEAKSMFPENFVFAECEFAADEDYQQEAMSYGYNASGKFQHSLAGLPKVPKDGYYVYRTNPDPKTVPWYISGAMRVKRLLNDRETAEILRENGSRMVPRRGGELDLKAWGFDRTDFSDDGNVKLSKPAGDREIDLMRLERPASTQAEALEALKALSGVNIVNRETGIAAQINRTQRDKLVSGAALAKSQLNGFTFADHFHAVANIDRLFMNGSLVDDRADRKGNPDVVSIKRFVAPAWLNGDFAEAYITVKETTGNKLYSLELDELKKPSDLKGGTFKERYHIPEGYDTLLRKVEKARRVFLKNEEKAKLSKPSAKLSEMTDEAKGFVRSLFTNGGHSKPDVNPWAKTFGTIFHYARQVPSLERMFDAAANLAENKTKLLKQLFNGETGRDIPGELRALEAKQPEEYRKLNDYMLKQDRNRAGGFVHVNETDGKFVACDLEGNAVDWFDSEEAAWERVFAEERKDVVAHGIMGETAAELLYQVRNAFNRSYMELRGKAESYRKRCDEYGMDYPMIGEGKDAVSVFEAMKKIGDLRGSYFPRVRHGDYLLFAHKEGENPRLEAFTNKAARAVRELALKRQGYEVRLEKSSRPSDEVYTDVSIAGMNDLLNRALNSMTERGITFEELDLDVKRNGYKLKNGEEGEELVISGHITPSMKNVLKQFGGQFYNGAWHFKEMDQYTEKAFRKALAFQKGIQIREAGTFGKAIAEQLAMLLHMRGASSHKIARSDATGKDVYLGYEEDLRQAFGVSVASIAGSSAKSQAAQEMMEAFTGTDMSYLEWLDATYPDEKEPGDIPGLEKPESEKEHAQKGIFRIPKGKTYAGLCMEYMDFCEDRRIDSGKQPNAYKSGMDFYKDMMRNNSNLEDALGKYKGWMSVYFLSRASSGLVNMTTMLTHVPAMMSAYGKTTIPHAMKLVAQESGKYLQYLRWNKFGKGHALNSSDAWVYDKIHEFGWDNSQMEREVAGTVLTWGGKLERFITEKALWVFSSTERFNRNVTIAAGYRGLLEAERKETGKEISEERKIELLRQAKKDISDRSHGVYGKLNLPDVIRGDSPLAVGGRMYYDYKTYTHNTIQDMVELGMRGKNKELAWMLLAPAVIGGAKASVLLTLANLIWSALGGDPVKDVEQWWYETAHTLGGEPGERFARMGAAGTLGLDLRGSMSMAGIAELPKTTEELLGAPYAFGKGILTGAGLLAKGRYAEGAEKILPAALSAPVKAVREQAEGVTDKKGRPVKYEDKQIVPDVLDTLSRSLGFNPAGISEKREKLWSEKKAAAYYRERRAEIYAHAREWAKTPLRKRSEWAKVMREVEEYNAKVKRSGRKGIAEITDEGLRRAMR